jgi:hypothetical protein
MAWDVIIAEFPQVQFDVGAQATIAVTYQRNSGRDIRTPAALGKDPDSIQIRVDHSAWLSV